MKIVKGLVFMMAAQSAWAIADIQFAKTTENLLVINNHGDEVDYYLDGVSRKIAKNSGILISCYDNELFEVQVGDDVHLAECHTMIEIGKGD